MREKIFVRRILGVPAGGSGVYRDFSGEGDLGLTKIITFFSEKKITLQNFS